MAHFRILGISMPTMLMGLVLSAQWHYTAVDSTRLKWGDFSEPFWLKYFGITHADLNTDGFQDIATGRYLYENPGLYNAAPWKRTILDENVDIILSFDVDADAYVDLIAMRFPELLWIEATNEEATEFDFKIIAKLPVTGHRNSQGFRLVTGLFHEGSATGFLIAGANAIHYFEPQNDSGETKWHFSTLVQNTSDEGIGYGDIDGDGLNDIIAGRIPQGEKEPTELYWYKNPGKLDELWQENYLLTTINAIDRIEVINFDTDSENEIVFTEERWPGKEPDARMVLLDRNNGWQEKVLVTQYSMNNLDVGDIDKDGLHDIITAEHKGPRLQTQIWYNKGNLNFEKYTVDVDKEHHLGTRLVDMDGDGDLDIIGAAWDNFSDVHYWENRLDNPNFQTEGYPLEKSKDQNLSRKVDTVEVHILQNNRLGRPHFKVKTPEASYFVDIKSGGISSIVDEEGRDWVNFRGDVNKSEYPSSAENSYRGIPNIVYGQPDDNGAGHPGFDRGKTVQTSENSLVFNSDQNTWSWKYTFFEDHVMFELLKKPEASAYWFLYEGTPGGKYDHKTMTYGMKGVLPQNDLPDFAAGSSKENDVDWYYFGKNEVERTFFLSSNPNKPMTNLVGFLGISSKGLESKDGMVVFGFGRKKGAIPTLTKPRKFIFGFFNAEITNQDDLNALEEKITALNQMNYAE